MPEDSGNPMSGALAHKVGPLPVYAWLMAAGAAGFILVKIAGGKKAASSGGGADSGQGTDFSSTQTQTSTDPTTGDTTSTSYTAQGNGYLPGMLTYGAGAMPYQQGDVYVNLPAQTTTPTAAPVAPVAPGQLQGVKPFTFPGTTNLTWTLGSGTTTEVVITGTPTDSKYGGPRSEVVDQKGLKAGESSGHMFVIDAVSRGATFNYTLTPYNEGVAGTPTNIQVKNAA